MSRQRFWRFLDEDYDGTGNIEFTDDYTGSGYGLPGIRDPLREIYIHKIRIYLADDGATPWRSNRWSASVTGLNRWVGFTIGDYSSGAIVTYLQVNRLPKREREFELDAGTERDRRMFTGAANREWRIWTYDFSGTEYGTVRLEPSTTRLQCFLNNDFTSMIKFRVAAEISYGV